MIVEVQTSTLAGRRIPFKHGELRRGVLVGRAPDCKLRFNPGTDLKVSGHHALLIETRKGVFVRDKGSSNGVYVNGRRVPAEGTRLFDGDEVRLGQEGALLILRIPDETAPEDEGNSGPDSVRATAVAEDADVSDERRSKWPVVLAAIALLAVLGGAAAWIVANYV